MERRKKFCLRRDNETNFRTNKSDERGKSISLSKADYNKARANEGIIYERKKQWTVHHQSSHASGVRWERERERAKFTSR